MAHDVAQVGALSRLQADLINRLFDYGHRLWGGIGYIGTERCRCVVVVGVNQERPDARIELEGDAAIVGGP